MWTGTTNPCWLSGLGWASTYAVTPPGATARACAPSIATGLPARLVAASTGVTPVPVRTRTVFPPGVMAMASGVWPTMIGCPGSSVAVLIGVMVSPRKFATYMVLPSAVMASAPGDEILIGLAAVSAPARTGTTSPVPGQETYTVLLSGVIAIVSGVIAIAMFSGFPRAQTVTIGPGLFVAVRIAVSVTGAAAPGRRPPAPTTYAVWPSGLIAICAGPRPTLIGLPAVLLAARIGVTVSSPAFAT